MSKIILSLVLASSFLFSFEMDYTKDTLGIVRNIKVIKDPKWVSKIELRNGKKIFFSSPKSMFEFYFRPGKWFDIGLKNEHDFKNRKNNKRMDRLQQTYECSLLYTCF